MNSSQTGTSSRTTLSLPIREARELGYLSTNAWGEACVQGKRAGAGAWHHVSLAVCGGAAEALGPRDAEEAGI